MSWVDDEPSFADFCGDWAAAVRGARGKLAWLVIVTVGVTALVGSWRMLHARTFRAAIVMRVSETLLTEQPPPVGDVELASYVADVFLSRETLGAIIEQHGLYPQSRGKNLSLALERMQQDIEIAVTQNYFAPERFIADPLRTARIVISYNGETPEQALAVVRDLGGRIVRERAQQRSSSARANAEAISAEGTALRQQLLLARAQQTRLTAHYGESMLVLVRIAGLLKLIDNIEDDLTDHDHNENDFTLVDGLENEGLGMRFEVIDPGRLPSPELGRSGDAVLFGALALSCALPLAALGFGILPGRIAHPRDLERMGIDVLGTISARGDTT